MTTPRQLTCASTSSLENHTFLAIFPYLDEQSYSFLSFTYACPSLPSLAYSLVKSYYEMERMTTPELVRHLLASRQASRLRMSASWCTCGYCSAKSSWSMSRRVEFSSVLGSTTMESNCLPSSYFSICQQFSPYRCIRLKNLLLAAVTICFSTGLAYGASVSLNGTSPCCYATGGCASAMCTISHELASRG